MKRILTIAAIAAVALTMESCRVLVDKSKKDQPRATKTYDAKDFSTISLSCVAEVTLVQDSAYSIQVDATQEFLDRLTITNTGDRLDISCSEQKMSRTLSFGGNADQCHIVIAMPTLEGVNVAGSGEVKVGDFSVPGNIVLSIAGSGDIDTGMLRAAQVDATIAGSGDIDLSATEVPVVNVSIAGSGDADLDLHGCGDVKVDIAGSGDVEIKGTAASIEKKVAGSGDIDTSELRIVKKPMPKGQTTDSVKTQNS